MTDHDTAGVSGPVGVVGLGAMGGAVAARLVEAGRSVVVHDPSPAATERAVAAGARPAALADLAAGCDAVVLSLPDADVVSAVLDDLLGAPGRRLRLVVDTSTIGPDAARAHAARCGEHGVDHADAPVLGRPAAVGAWTLPVGGPHADAVRDLLGPVAARVVPVGGPGAGATVKVVNNQMLAVINAATAEALAVATAAGLDPGVFVDTVIDSGAASVSGLFRDIGPRAVDGDLDPVFTLALMHKDNALAVSLAEGGGVPVEVTRAALALHARGLDAGLGGRDSVAVVDVVGDAAGVVVRRATR